MAHRTAPHHYVEYRYLEVGFSLPSALSTCYNVLSAVTYSKRIPPWGANPNSSTRGCIYIDVCIFSLALLVICLISLIEAHLSFCFDLFTRIALHGYLVWQMVF
jgi:hypothetical protein